MADRTGRKSFIGGFLGGCIGYAIGALVGSTWVAFALFFVVGYLGYDLRAVLAAMPTAGRGAVKWLGVVTGNSWNWIKDWHFAPLLTLWMIPAITILLHAMGNEAWASETDSSYLAHAWACFMGNWEWLQTGVNPLAPEINNEIALELRQFTYYTFLLGAMTGAAVAWALTGVVLHGIAYALKNIAKWPMAAAWGIFFVTAGPVLLTLKFVALLIIAVHDIRRVACAVSTAVTGALYLVFVPFSFAALPLGVTAIGCGLAAGGVSLLVSLSVSSEKTRAAVASFFDRPISTYAPAFMQAE